MQEYRKSFGKSDPLGTIAGDAPIAPTQAAFEPDTPLSPYFAIKIGSTIYDMSHDYLVSMRFKEMESFLGQMTFEIEDTMDLDLESKFMELINEQGNGISSFQFGWQGMNVQDLSPWIPFFVVDYTPTFHPPHSMRISVQCQTTDQKEDNIAHYKAKNWNDIITQLCQREGWAIGDFDKADPPESGEEIDITQANMETLAFIRREILPKCLCKGVGMDFWVDSSGGIPTAYFLSESHNLSKPKETFLIYAGRYSNVLSFSPSYSGKQMAAGSQEIGFIDEETGDIKIWKAGEEPGKTKAEINVINSSNADYMKALITNKWIGRNVSSYNATLTTVGNFRVKPLDSIDIIPFRLDGTPHYSAGNYFVTEVEHTISGKFTTTYTLRRNVEELLNQIDITENDENNTRVKKLPDGAAEEIITDEQMPEATPV